MKTGGFIVFLQNVLDSVKNKRTIRVMIQTVPDRNDFSSLFLFFPLQKAGKSGSDISESLGKNFRRTQIREPLLLTCRQRPGSADH